MRGLNQRIGSSQPVAAATGASMPERDGYIFGGPCWVDVSEADTEAALDFYGGLFGWEFENVMATGSEGDYFIARREAPSSSIFDTSRELRSGDVAAIGTIPQAAPPTRPRPRFAMPAEASWWSPSTSWTPAGWPFSRIPRERRFASGKRRRTRVH